MQPFEKDCKNIKISRDYEIFNFLAYAWFCYKFIAIQYHKQVKNLQQSYDYMNVFFVETHVTQSILC